jgi:uncharacterized protein (DUF779 family)
VNACRGLTARAHRLLARVRAAEDPDAPPLAFLISGGCCGGTNPVLCRRSNVMDGFDVPLGEVDGIGIFAHPEHARYLVRDRFVIDALDDPRSDTFSLEIPHGGRFVLRELSVDAASSG